MDPTTIAIDVSKSVFEIAVSNRAGHVFERHRLTRSRLVPFFAKRRPATVLLEACGSAHHWGRRLQDLGHHVVLLPPHAVRPYVFRNKTDRADAKGSSKPFATTRSIPSLSSPLTSRRPQPCLVCARPGSPLAPREDADSGLPDALRAALAEACTEIRQIEGRIHDGERQLARLARDIPAAIRLLSIPGGGLLTATALVAFVGDLKRFPSGRHFACFLGLTPRERSSGSIRRLGAISNHSVR